MIKLITSNTKKYEDFEERLKSLRVQLEVCREELIERQGEDFIECISFKALQAAEKYGEPVFVDDSGFIIDQYAPFPSTMTKLVLKQLGIAGLKKLVGKGDGKAKMLTILGIAIEGQVYHWQGIVEGILNFDMPINNPKMPLSDIFIPDEVDLPNLAHRVRAFEALQKDIFKIHVKVDTFNYKKLDHASDSIENDFYCPFCIEINDTENSLFRTLVGNKIKNRILYEDEHFILIVPLGEFMPGGLLLLSKKHIPSFAYLDSELYDALEKLINKIKISLENVFGISPIVFEHGAAIDKSKGRCCVDHAHFNIFPVNINVHNYLKDKMFSEIYNLKEISQFKLFSEGYIYIDSPVHGQFVYDGFDIPSQLIRRFITKELGYEERWHWRDYLGIEEMIQTMDKLYGVIK